MKELKITVKNYRCFGAKNPVSVTIGTGFTALVGPNNCGKSSFLKLFSELRDLWNRTGTVPTQCGWTTTISIAEVQDPAEILSDRNNLPPSIEFESTPTTLDGALPPVSTVRFTSTRAAPQSWQFDLPKVPRPNAPGVTVEVLTSQVVEVVESTQDGLNTQRIRTEVADCSSIIADIRALGNSLYVGPFRNAIGQSSGHYYGLAIGNQFVVAWNSWKTGRNKQQNRTITRVTEDVRRLFGFASLEISAAEGLGTLHVTVDRQSYKLHELGAGLAQCIVVLGNAAFSQPRYIFVDEPELSLHPSLQVDFLTSLASYAIDGVIFATHSIGLARATADRIYSFQRQNDDIICRPFEQTPNYAEFLGEMSFSSFRELGFDRVLLVEGVTDVKTIQQFLRMLQKDHKIVVIPLGGNALAKGGMELELGELKRITTKISVLVDSERDSEGGLPNAHRVNFEASCKRLGFDVHLTARRATENYFTEHAIREVKNSEKYRALGAFEALKNCDHGWEKNENWRIAREMRWEEIEGTDLGKFLQAL